MASSDSSAHPVAEPSIASLGGEAVAPPLVAPLTWHQERLCFIDQFERDRVYPHAPTYHNVAVWLWLRGPVDPAALRGALGDLVARHDALRSNCVDGTLSVRASATPALRLADAPESRADLARRAILDNRQPFLIESDLLLRATLYRRAGAHDADDDLLALSIHHIVCDLHATDLIVEEFIELYRARVECRPAALPAPLRFSAYAQWLRGLPDTAFQAARSFWRWQLEGEMAPLELPYARARHRIHVYACGERAVTIAADRLAALRRDVDPSVHTRDLLLAVFAAALHACSGQRELLVGTTHPGREAGLEGLVGPLANLLVLRLRLDPGASFHDHLRHVQRTVRQATANRALPFDRLVQDVNPPKDMSRTALFDVLFDVLDAEPFEWTVPGATVVRQDRFVGFGKYDLACTLRARGSEAQGLLAYNRELFDETFIEDFVALFDAILDRVAADAAAPLAAQRHLPPALAERQLALLQAAPGVTPRHETLDAAFDAVAGRWPDRVAIVSDEGTVTYRQVRTMARRVDRSLREAGVGPSEPVVLFAGRTADAVGAMLGILRAGAAYVPVDPAAPARRSAALIEDAGARLAVTTPALREALQASAGAALRHIVEIVPPSAGDAAAAAPAVTTSIASAQAADPAEPATPTRSPSRETARRSRSTGDGVAYSIYTSGSTGLPKGCLVTHRNVVRLLLGQTAAFGFGIDDVWSWAHAFSFDFSVWELFGTLLHGARGLLLSTDTVRDPDRLAGTLAREQVTVLSQTPAAGYRLTERALDAGVRLESLRWMVFGGDVLSPVRLEAWAHAHPSLRIANMYGITETTVHVTLKTLSLDDLASESRSVGRALPDVAAFIIDERLDLRLAGVPGEIVVTGDGVSLGYAGRPDLTAARFVPDPFSRRAGARMYRSGDRGHLRPDGEIWFRGRDDLQVKIRGHRVELGEIEGTLAGHPDVSDAAVIATDEEGGGRRLIAFVRSARDVDPDALRRYLRERLLPAMIPSAIQQVRELPRTATGKLDRRALAGQVTTSEPSPRAYAAPRDARERALVRIWETVLARAPIGIRDNFFDVGGDSILCMQICARAARAGLRLTPKLLFEWPTIEELVPHLDTSPLLPSAAAAGHGGRAGGLAPLLPAQAWFFAQQQPEPRHFNQSAWFDLAPHVTAARVDAAARHLRARHDALRLQFVQEDGEVWQRAAAISDAPADPLVTVLSFDTAQDASACREATLAAAGAAQRSLDLDRGPVFRWLFVHPHHAEPARVLMVFHHLVIDTVSWRVIVDELGPLLAAGADEEQPDEPIATAMALLDCAWMRADAVRPRAQAPAPPADDALPHGALADVRLDRAAPADSETRGDDETYAELDEYEISLDRETTSAIAQGLAHEHLSWEAAIVAAAAHALLHWTGRDRVDLYLEGHGRDLDDGPVDASRTIGWFMRLYGLRIARTDGDAAAAARAAQDAITAAKHQPDLLERLAADACRRRASGIADEASASRLVPGLCVNYLGQVDGLAADGGPLTLVDRPTGGAIGGRNRRAHRVDLHAVGIGGCMRLRWSHPRGPHRRAAIEAMADRCRTFLRDLSRAAAASTSEMADEPYPLLPGQLGMLYRSLLSVPGAPECCLHSLLQLDGALDLDAFRASWALLIDRHDALRASFSWHRGQPIQRIAPQAVVPIGVEDWRSAGLDEAALAERLEAYVRDRLAAACDLATPPLIALHVVRASATRWFVLVRMHHLIVDGWSYALLRDELLTIYGALSRGAPVRLAAAGRFRDHLCARQPHEEEAAARFWRRALEGAEPCRLPPPDETGGGVLLESLEQEVCERPRSGAHTLAGWAAARDLTVTTVLLGLWTLVIGCLTSRTSTLTGLVTAGRALGAPDADRTVGAFITTMPVLARADRPDAPLDAWLAQLQLAVAEAHPFAGWPVAQMAAWAGLPAGQPLFDTIIVCQNYPVGVPPRVAGLDVRELRYGIKEGVPVVLECVFAERLHLRLRYRPDLVSGSLVPDAGHALRAAIEAIERMRDLQVGQLRALVAVELEARARSGAQQFAAARRRGLAQRLGESAGRDARAGAALTPPADRSPAGGTA